MYHPPAQTPRLEEDVDEEAGEGVEGEAGVGGDVHAVERTW